MEKLPVAEQIFYMKYCEEVASLDGTVAHNILMEVPLVLIDVYKEPYKSYPLNHDDGPFFVCVSRELKQYICKSKWKYKCKGFMLVNIKNAFMYTCKCLYLGRIKPALMPLYKLMKKNK